MLFGEKSIDPDELARGLVRGVVRKVEQGEDWTEAVRTTLMEIGTQKKHYVAPNPESGQHEYLLDVLWFKNSESNDIVLAVESEWGGKGNVWEDFEKLMHIKAPLKVMVFSTRSHGQQSEIILKGIEESYMRKFTQHVKKEYYLLIEFVHPRQEVYVHSYEVPKDGELEKAQFQPPRGERIPYSQI